MRLLETRHLTDDSFDRQGAECQPSFQAQYGCASLSDRIKGTVNELGFALAADLGDRNVPNLLAFFRSSRQQWRQRRI